MASKLPADYSLHDGVYQRLRKDGASGWNEQPEYQDMLERIQPLLPALQDSGSVPKILELGSGAGNFSLLLAQQGYDLTGVEISPTAVAWAQDKARAEGANAAFQVDNVVELASCGNAAFDVVVDGHCLHCIVGADRASCLAAVLRVLRPGGTFIVLTMCGDVRNKRLLAEYDPASNIAYMNGRPTRYIGKPAAIVAELVAAGFVIESSKVDPRDSDDDQDDILIRARKPRA